MQLYPGLHLEICRADQSALGTDFHKGVVRDQVWFDIFSLAQGLRQSQDLFHRCVRTDIWVETSWHDLISCLLALDYLGLHQDDARVQAPLEYLEGIKDARISLGSQARADLQPSDGQSTSVRDPHQET